jgi:phosphonopyruvate decarboxylase
MINPEGLYNFLKDKGIGFFTGVPDSLLKNFLSCLQDKAASHEHIIAANEGLAVSLASGYYLSSGKIPLVYLQNSGLGNMVNPLTSLLDKEMYSIPVLLMIGWRGRPGVKDEPQHKKMGRITIPLLDVLEVPVFLIEGESASSFKTIEEAISLAISENKPVALLVQEDIFEKYEVKPSDQVYSLIRENVIHHLIKKLTGDEIVVCSTGKAGREFYEKNIEENNKVKKYFLSVGAMGHASHIAFGISMNVKEKVIILDGDGALLMQLGTLPVIAHHACGNFIHIVINNGSHESVGGQSTEGFFVDFCLIAKGCGFKKTTLINTSTELDQWLNNGLDFSGVQFVEIRTFSNSRNDLGRPAGNPENWKDYFMTSLLNRDK